MSEEKKTPEVVVTEDAPVNAVGGGAVAGTGVGPKGEPGRSPLFNPKLVVFKRMIARKRQIW